MSNYKFSNTALAGRSIMSLGGRSIMSLGAVSSAEADAAAKAALAAQSGTWAIAYVNRDGAVSRIETFSSRDNLHSSWDAMVDNNTIPADIAEIVWLDKEDEAADPGSGYNFATNPLITTSVLSKINWKKTAPWIIGGSLLIAAAVYYSRKQKRSPRRPSRRRAAWRRRTITTWR